MSRMLPCLTVLLWAAMPAFADETAYGGPNLRVGGNVVLAGPLEIAAFEEDERERLIIVDLRTAAEGVEEEAAAAAALGIDYRNIPVAGATIDPAQVDALAAIIGAASPDTTVVVHCASGNRAGMLWSAVELEAGRPLDEVLNEASGIVTREPVVTAIRDYAASLGDDAR